MIIVSEYDCAEVIRKTHSENCLLMPVTLMSHANFKFDNSLQSTLMLNILKIRLESSFLQAAVFHVRIATVPCVYHAATW